MACNSLPRRCISNTVASVQGHDKYRVTDENGPANLMVASSKAFSNYVIDDLPAAHAPPASCIGGLSRLVGNPPKHPPGPCPSLPPVPLALSAHLSPQAPQPPKSQGSLGGLVTCLNQPRSASLKHMLPACLRLSLAAATP